MPLAAAATLWLTPLLKPSLACSGSLARPLFFISSIPLPFLKCCPSVSIFFSRCPSVSFQPLHLSISIPSPYVSVPFPHLSFPSRVGPFHLHFVRPYPRLTEPPAATFCHKTYVFRPQNVYTHTKHRSSTFCIVAAARGLKSRFPAEMEAAIRIQTVNFT